MIIASYLLLSSSPSYGFAELRHRLCQPSANVLSIVIIGSEKTPTPTPVWADLRDLASTRYLRDLGPSYA